jgi:hypothetical protein
MIDGFRLFVGYEKAYRSDHMLILPAKINGSSPKLFLMDTGSWDNTLSRATAKENAKLHDEYGAVKVKGLSGEVNKVYTTGDVLLDFSNFKQQRTDMIAFDMTNTSNHAGIELSGTLGFAMLFLFDIQIDYRDNLVKFGYDPYRLH